MIPTSLWQITKMVTNSSTFLSIILQCDLAASPVKNRVFSCTHEIWAGLMSYFGPYAVVEMVCVSSGPGTLETLQVSTLVLNSLYLPYEQASGGMPKNERLSAKKHQLSQSCCKAIVNQLVPAYLPASYVSDTVLHPSLSSSVYVSPAKIY